MNWKMISETVQLITSDEQAQNDIALKEVTEMRADEHSSALWTYCKAQGEPEDEVLYFRMLDIMLAQQRQQRSSPVGDSLTSP